MLSKQKRDFKFHRYHKHVVPANAGTHAERAILSPLAHRKLSMGSGFRRNDGATMSDTLDDITAKTLAHYEHSAAAFFAGTIDHDVSQNINALLSAIQAEPPFTILDLGCGPGRDLKTFASLGHHAIGLDGCEQFVEMARAFSGCDVWHQNLLHLQLPPEMFDGIFANAVLFHVPSAALPKVLADLHAALKPGGVLFSSNPRGHNEEGWSGPRYGSYYDYETWKHYVTAAGFVPLHHYYRPAGLPREQQPWLASVWRKL